MHKIISGLTLLLWGGCFIHCFAEQLGIDGLQATHAITCCGEDTDSEGAPSDPSDPCNICDICDFGGSTLVSQSSLLLPPSDFGIDIDNFLSIGFSDSTTEPEPLPPDANAAKGYLRVLCEELVLTGLPVRGPTLV